MDVTVYTKPNCPQCVQTKRLLDRDNVAYQEAQIGDEERQKFLEHGFMSAPDGSWLISLWWLVAGVKELR